MLYLNTESTIPAGTGITVSVDERTTPDGAITQNYTFDLGGGVETFEMPDMLGDDTYVSADVTLTSDGGDTPTLERMDISKSDGFGFVVSQEPAETGSYTQPTVSVAGGMQPITATNGTQPAHPRTGPVGAITVTSATPTDSTVTGAVELGEMVAESPKRLMPPSELSVSDESLFPQNSVVTGVVETSVGTALETGPESSHNDATEQAGLDGITGVADSTVEAFQFEPDTAVYSQAVQDGPDEAAVLGDVQDEYSVTQTERQLDEEILSPITLEAQQSTVEQVWSPVTSESVFAPVSGYGLAPVDEVLESMVTVNGAVTRVSSPFILTSPNTVQDTYLIEITTVEDIYGIPQVGTYPMFEQTQQPQSPPVVTNQLHGQAEEAASISLYPTVTNSSHAQVVNEMVLLDTEVLTIPEYERQKKRLAQNSVVVVGDSSFGDSLGGRSGFGGQG